MVTSAPPYAPQVPSPLQELADHQFQKCLHDELVDAKIDFSHILGAPHWKSVETKLGQLVKTSSQDTQTAIYQLFGIWASAHNATFNNQPTGATESEAGVDTCMCVAMMCMAEDLVKDATLDLGLTVNISSPDAANKVQDSLRTSDVDQIATAVLNALIAASDPSLDPRPDHLMDRLDEAVRIGYGLVPVYGLSDVDAIRVMGAVINQLAQRIEAVKAEAARTAQKLGVAVADTGSELRVASSII